MRCGEQKEEGGGAVPFKILASFCWIVLEADPLAAGFAVQGQELLLLLTVDADQVGSSSATVLLRCPPAFLQGPVHVVEELQRMSPPPRVSTEK